MRVDFRLARNGRHASQRAQITDTPSLPPILLETQFPLIQFTIGQFLCMVNLVGAK